jgi:predicted permease
MSRFEGVRRLLHITRNSQSVERAVNDELQFHFDMTVRELMQNGMNPDEARREAERRFGDVQRTRERLTTIDRARMGQERRAEWWSAFTQDLRYALRGLRLKPGFAVAVVLTLGLGIGANAAMFRIVDALLFRAPALLAHPDRVTRVYLTRTSRGKENISPYMGYRQYLDFRENTTSFDAMTPFYINKLAIGSGDATREMNVAVSTPDLWRLFDMRPVIGRFFTTDENIPTQPAAVIVISFAFWQTQFGGRNDALGSKVEIGSNRYTVIGVTPEKFAGLLSQPFIGVVPVSAHMTFDGFGGPKNPWYSTYSMNWFELFARRKPGVSVQRAAADLTQTYQKSYMKVVAANPRATAFAIAKPHAIAGPVLSNRGPREGNDAKVVTWLVGVAAIVLLIACANVANLLVARALRRRREIAVRIALGVSRSRLLMQLFTESVLLAALSGIVGVAIAQWGGTVMHRVLLPTSIEDPNAFTDPRVLGFALVLAVVAGLLTGLAPIVQTRRQDVSAALKAGTREGHTQRSRLRTSLLVAQAALSVVLLVGAGLFIRSLLNVQHLRLGYDADRLLWVDLNERGAKLDSVQNVALREQLMQRAATIPNVTAASRALTVPFWTTWQLQLFVTGIDSVAKLGDFTLQAASPTFFETMGTRIIAGRPLNTEDRQHSPYVIVIGELMAKKLWPNENALGKCIRLQSDTMPCRTVVGIAEDVRRGSLSEVEGHYYLPIEQFNRSQGGVFVRTKGPASDDVEGVRRALQAVMPGSSYVTITPLTTIIAPEIRTWRTGAIMFAVFGGLALVLAAIGLYSVIAYNVTQRTHEMGVRVALGAQGGDVIRLVVREGLTIVLPGIALGAIIALVAGKWIAPLLFNVSPKDPPVLATVVVVLICVAIAASWIPATRAARVDPSEALRAD